MQPLALVTWGHKLEISKVSLEVAVNFIQTYALKGPEEISRDGQYNLMLTEKARFMSDENDSKICSFYGPSEVDSM